MTGANGGWADGDEEFWSVLDVGLGTRLDEWADGDPTSGS